MIAFENSVMGSCFWWCGRDLVQVVRVGEIADDSSCTPLYACSRCLDRINARHYEQGTLVPPYVAALAP